MNYIFLDVDGVLNTIKTNERIGKVIGIEDEKLGVLRQIADVCGYPGNTRLILSSSWRYGWNDPEDDLCNYLKDKFSKENMVIYGVTPRLDGFHRGYEIMRYLVDTANFNAKNDNFIILDDEMFDYVEANIDDRVIKTSFYDENCGLRYVSVIKSRILCITSPKQEITKEYVDTYHKHIKGSVIPIDFHHNGKEIESFGAIAM